MNDFSVTAALWIFAIKLLYANLCMSELWDLDIVLLALKIVHSIL